jgi:chromosome segregation ATPase
MSKSEVKVSESKFSIVRAIAAKLNLGNDGKLDSFLMRIIKTLNNEIKAHKNNIRVTEFNHKEEVDVLNDKLEDAREELEDAYSDIPLEKVTTNSDQVDYMDAYLSKLDYKLNRVAALEKELEKSKESTTEIIDGFNDQIKDIETRIKAISKA